MPPPVSVDGPEVIARFDGSALVPGLLGEGELDRFGPLIDRAVSARQGDDERALAERSRDEQSLGQCINVWEDFPKLRPLTFHPRLARVRAPPSPRWPRSTRALVDRRSGSPVRDATEARSLRSPLRQPHARAGARRRSMARWLASRRSERFPRLPARGPDSDTRRGEDPSTRGVLPRSVALLFPSLRSLRAEGLEATDRRSWAP